MNYSLCFLVSHFHCNMIECPNYITSSLHSILWNYTVFTAYSFIAAYLRMAIIVTARCAITMWYHFASAVSIRIVIVSIGTTTRCAVTKWYYYESRNHKTWYHNILYCIALLCLQHKWVLELIPQQSILSLGIRFSL